ncbi:MAG: DUF3307 domain-containing protein [Lachnospiraceae bacterium]|nr:DUF3307 domain-containing protein [Lachnospiraceae bacterium]
MMNAHFLADFTFQTHKMAEEKVQNTKYLFKHAFIYAVLFLITMCLLIRWDSAIIPYFIIVVSHFIIDRIKIWVDKNPCMKIPEFTTFCIDQALHMLILISVYLSFSLGLHTTVFYDWLQGCPYSNRIAVYFLIFTILWDPASVCIKKLFEHIIGEPNSEDKLQYGQLIGKLERIIIAVLVLCEQFGAIGFVLAAKSIARYKQLEEQPFAEKYLVGTLSSVLIAFIVTLILKEFL